MRGNTIPNDPDQNYGYIQLMLLRLYTSLPHPETDTVVPRWQEVSSENKQYKNACDFLILMSILQYRQLFVTRERRFGFTMMGVRSGDMLSALNGSPVLHVQRRVPTEDDTETMNFEFVGSAYVHGLMNGESDDTDAIEENLVFV